MGRARQKKFDRILNGFLAGLFIPAAIFFGIYIFRYEQIPISEYLSQLWKLNITFKILSLCGFANLLLFFWFYRNKMDRAAKGIIMGTLVYALLFLVFEIL
jgi:uncharacterized BrkB/YihY/UPF0761 family membrane protein